MMKFLFMLVALATASSLIEGSKSEEASDVEELIGEVLERWIKSHPIALVMFYSSKNSLSRELLPIFDTLAAATKRQQNDAAFAKIDCTWGVSDMDFCRPYIAGDFPIITVFREGHPWTRELNPAIHPIHEQDLYMEKTANGWGAKNDFDAAAFTADYAQFMRAVTELQALRKEKEEEDKYPVDNITDINFSAWLKRNPVALVMFYSPTIVNYRTVLPIYGAYVASLKRTKANAKIVKIDCTAVTSKKSCLPYFKSNTLTFTVFRDGQPWSGEETAEAYRVQREVVQNIYERVAEEKNDLDKDTFNAPYMTSLRKAMAVLDALMREKTETGEYEESDDSESDDLYPDDVAVFLTGHDVSARLKSHPVALVFFYSPTSLYYRRVTPFFDTFSKVLHQTYPDTMFAKIDCSEEESEYIQDVCDEQVEDDNIPAFAVFKHGVPTSTRTSTNAYKSLPKERLRETSYLKGLYAVVDEEFSDLQDAEFIGPLKNALTALVGVHIEMGNRTKQTTRGQEL